MDHFKGGTSPFAYSSLGEMYYRRAGFRRDDIETYKWLALAAAGLPDGSARTKTASLLADIKKKMSNEDIKKADKKVAEWRPLKQTASRMRDKDD